MNWWYFGVLAYVILWLVVEIKQLSVYHGKGWWKRI